MKKFLRGLFAGALLVSVLGGAAAKAEDAVVADGKTVKFDYSLSVDGKEVENSTGKQPISYVQGSKSILPALQKQLEGLKVGAEKTVMLKAADAYGEPDPKAIQEVPKKLIDPKIELKPGLLLQMTDPSGNIFPATVKEIKDDKVVMDFNHPLVGKDLTFKIKIDAIQ